MKVPPKLLNTAKALLTHGDVSKIMETNQLSRYEVQQVFEDGDATPEAIAAVATYYAEKEALLSDFLND